MTEFFEYGAPSASVVLIQPVSAHDLPEIEEEARAIRSLTDAEFRLIAVKVADWDADLSPWRAPAVFGNRDFGGGAEGTLRAILPLCADGAKTYHIGGYSLAGLFALWAAYRTEAFSGTAAASPSVWFPGFTDFMKANGIQCGAVYLSLGDQEEKAKNPVTASVGDRIREAREILTAQGTRCVLEWNPGNHFRDAALRTAKAFAWLMNNGRE